MDNAEAVDMFIIFNSTKICNQIVYWLAAVDLNVICLSKWCVVIESYKCTNLLDKKDLFVVSAGCQLDG
jgi:hypothetical protein